MSHNSSSTSSSEGEPASPDSSTAGHLREALVVTVWLVATLALIDVSLNTLLPGPKGSNRASPGTLVQYFDYGRSIEGKIRRLIGPDDASTALVAQAGWLEPGAPPEPSSDRAQQTKVSVAVYGMSFSEQAAQAMADLDPRIKLRLMGGPAAPASHSFAWFLEDSDRHNAKVVILGILASSVKGLASMSAMNWQFEGPAPYTFPRYHRVGGKLEATWPGSRSLPEFRACLADRSRWASYVEQMRRHDDFYNPFLFDENWLDSSALVRLVRRAVAAQHIRRVERTFHTTNGFVAESAPLASLRAIVEEFAAKARLQNRLPSCPPHQ